MIDSHKTVKTLLEVFSQPGVLFAGLNERKRAWIVPVIADAILLVLISALAGHYIGIENIMRRQFEAFHMPPEQMEKALAAAASPAGVYRGYVFTALGTPLVLLVIGGVLAIFSMMTSRPPKFSAMYSMVAIAFFPYWLVTCVMTALILMLAPDPEALDPTNFVATNVGAFVDKESLPKGLYSLLTSLDLLSFAEIGLLAYGFSRLTRTSFFGGLAAVLALWVLYVSSKMALSLLF